MRGWIGYQRLREEKGSQQDEAFHGELDSACAGMSIFAVRIDNVEPTVAYHGFAIVP